jgi:hypothetical protein
MKDKKASSNLESYFWDSLRTIEICLDQVDEGQPEFYRVIAAQLRLLLCDTTREHDQVVDISLLPRVFPGIQLQPLGKKGYFSQNAEPIPLNKWLEQKVEISNGTVTLRKLIRHVCDHEGGVHVDPRQISRKVLRDEREWILEIGRYLAEEDIEDKPRDE